MKRQPLIGSTWTDSKGRTWEVTEMVNPGLYRVCVFKATENGGRVAVRVGESYVRNIRAAIAASMVEKEHGCHDCGEERRPRIVAGRLTCPDCGSENIVCIE